jgi:zinc transport system permease protein
MISLWHSLISFLPFEWASYDFMRNALFAVLIVAPCFGLIGTMIVGRGMAFFSDVIGHSALTGIALGVVLGLSDPRPAMIVFVIVLAFLMNAMTAFTRSSTDTIIGVFSAAVVALGVAVLSRGGSFNKYSVYLVGDILSVAESDILGLAFMFAMVLLFWLVLGNRLILSGIDPSFMSGKKPSAFVIQSLFSILVAAVVAFSIRWVGILIINSLLILPAASSRLVTSTVRGYVLISVIISIVSGITGLVISFYAGTAGGATIVLCSVAAYCSALIIRYVKNGQLRK